jgi:hypothetical protein
MPAFMAWYRKAECIASRTSLFPLNANERFDTPVIKEYDYEGLMTQFQDIVGDLMNKNPQFYGPRITQIVDKYLGKGKKVSDATIDQAEFISLIIDEINAELKSE